VKGKKTDGRSLSRIFLRVAAERATEKIGTRRTYDAAERAVAPAAECNESLTVTLSAQRAPRDDVQLAVSDTWIVTLW